MEHTTQLSKEQIIKARIEDYFNGRSQEQLQINSSLYNFSGKLSREEFFNSIMQGFRNNPKCDLQGMVVYIKPEFQDEGDDDFFRKVIEDRGDRVLVEIENCLSSINPTQVLLKSQIKVY